MIVVVWVRTIVSLGLRSVARVAKYRISLGSGFGSIRKASGPAPDAPFFRDAINLEPAPAPAPVENLSHEVCYFGWKQVAVRGSCPDWFFNPFSGKRAVRTTEPWWQIPDFDPEMGDIKAIWELSRFDWVLGFAQQARAGQADAVSKLERWLVDWCHKNPPYRGPNWKCGQEASIRVLHLALGAVMLGLDRSAARGLVDLISVHLSRIEPTIGYAIGQDNNHGTSEAAALFVGGAWLRDQGDSRGEAWVSKGRFWLEDRVDRLVASDGSFSQHSTNYHRMLLDTLCIVEAWRRRRSEPAFSSNFYAKAATAARFLNSLVDPTSGDAPNTGANDGARLMPLTSTGYRDYRPSVQTSMAIFANERAYSHAGSFDHPLAWLGIPLPSRVASPPRSELFDAGGYAVLHSDDTMVLMRYPRFRFRPSHADALHVDLWHGGRGKLRDAGTFSYAASAADLAYFAGTASHNTVQFDDRDQMPRLGRFLFGNWIRAEQVSLSPAPVPRIRAGYRDAWGAWHEREVVLLPGRLVVRDRLGGTFSKAVLRWRLLPGAWRLEGDVVTNGLDRLVLSSDAAIARIEVVDGYESLYYAAKVLCPVVELEIRHPGSITTEYVLGS